MPLIRKVRAQRRALTYALAEDIISEYLKQEAVPDVLVEVVTSSSSDAFAPHPEWLRDQIGVANSIIDDLVKVGCLGSCHPNFIRLASPQ